jgi:hypothetical protein
MYDSTRVYNDPILTNFAVGYRDQALVAPDMFPETPVLIESGQYRVFDRSDWLMFDDQRAPGASANEVRGAAWSIDNFRTKEHALKVAVTDEEIAQFARASASAATNLVAITPPLTKGTQLVTRAIDLRLENDAQTLVRNLANYPTANKLVQSSGNKWDNYASSTSDPITDIVNARRAIRTATGFEPTDVWIPFDVETWLPRHPKVLSQFQYVAAVPPIDAVFRAANFQGTVHIMDSQYNSNDTPAAGEAMVKFWGKDVIFAYVDPTPGMETQTWAKRFSWIFPNGQTTAVARWRDEDRESILVRVKKKYDLKIVNSKAAYIIQGAVS